MRYTLMITAALLAGPALAANVDVKLDHPENFADARDNLRSKDDVGKALAEHLQALGSKNLPADQKLEITIRDIDLAGDMRPRFRTGQDVRIIRGRADWPRVDLSYVLRSGDKVLSQGSESIADMNYTMNQSYSAGSQDAFFYEKRMLTKWFRERLAPDMH